MILWNGVIAGGMRFGGPEWLTFYRSRQGRYRAKNGRIVRLIASAANHVWAGIFEIEFGARGYGRNYIWHSDGSCDSRRDGSWDLIECLEQEHGSVRDAEVLKQQ